MRTYAEIISAHTEKVSSPDGHITATLSGTSVSHVEFAPGSYPRYTERSLEAQIIALVKLVIVAQKRVRRRAIEEGTPSSVQYSSGWELTEKEKQLKDKLADTEGEAHSDDISVYAHPSGTWDIEIADGYIKETRSREFIAEALPLISEALADMEHKTTLANNEVYGHISDISNI